MNNEFYCVGNRMIWKIDRNNEFGIIKQCENYIILIIIFLLDTSIL